MEQHDANFMIPHSGSHLYHNFHTHRVTTWQERKNYSSKFFYFLLKGHLASIVGCAACDLQKVFQAVQSVLSRSRMGRTTAHRLFFWGALGWTTPREVRTGRTVGDYSPSAWISGTVLVQVRIIPSGRVIGHHETSLVPSFAVLCRASSFSTLNTYVSPCRAHHLAQGLPSRILTALDGLQIAVRSRPWLLAVPPRSPVGPLRLGAVCKYRKRRAEKNRCDRLYKITCSARRVTEITSSDLS